MRLYAGLVHYPVYNKHHQTIASAVTTVDLHDLARVIRTFDAERLFVITPLEDQQRMVARVQRHWTEGYGARYNPHRKAAMECIEVCESIECAVKTIAEREGTVPLTVGTGAARMETKVLSFREARELIKSNALIFLLFGTAWGLGQSVMDRVDKMLEPISGNSNYNHLSVRAAAAIILDRLAGRGVG